MTDWHLLGGAVTLTALGQRAFWRILLVTPVTMILIYLMVPRRVSRRQAAWMLPTLYAVLWCVFLTAHLTVLPRGLSGLLGQLVKGLLEYVAFPLYYSKYRDFRTVFLMLTGGVICLQANSIGHLLLGGLNSMVALGLAVALSTLLLLYVFVRFQRPAIWFLMERQSGGWWVFCSIPALLCGTLLLFRAYPDPFSGRVQNPIGMAMAVLLQPVVYRVLFHALEAQRRQVRLEQDAALLQMQLHMMEEQGRLMERRIREEAAARHDRRHFRQIVLAHLDAGDIQGARAVIQELLSRSEPAAARRCEDPVLNQLLAYYAAWAEEEQTDFQAQVHIPGGLDFRRTELMVVVCNTLENAIHACARVPDPARRRLSLVLRAKGRQVYLEVSNTYAGTLRLDPVTGLPRTDAPGHGYGLERVAALTGQALQCSVEDGVFTIWTLV